MRRLTLYDIYEVELLMDALEKTRKAKKTKISFNEASIFMTKKEEQEMLQDEVNCLGGILLRLEDVHSRFN